ncbi:MAG: C40 family peptidase [Bacteroidales bacterium]|jgi:hypothetical protein|nr:C40 family peptidase [Bacteroidales bacterium]
MSSGISLLSNVAMRAQPSETAEMVSQLLFGDSFSVLQANAGWFRIRTCSDDYEGWVSANMVALTERVPEGGHIVSLPFAACRIMPDDVTVYLPGGSLFPELPFRFAGKTYTLEADATNIAGRDVVMQAEQYLGAPYLWGGKTVFGIDCSGLVQVVCRMVGKAVPRDASQQANCGQPVAFEDALRGDLAFFSNEHGQVKHVGILCGDGNIIHASGCVRKDAFDRKGIIHSTEKRYTHYLHSIRRLC